MFWGTPEFSSIILETLIGSPYKPSLVITAPTPSPVKTLVEKHKIPFLQPEVLDEDVKHKIQEINPDLFIVAAYGKIISQTFLDIPTHKSINVHPSLLPKLRGSSPIQNAIQKGLKDTGVSIMLMDNKMDHGPILTNLKFQISNLKTTADKLSEELAYLGAKLLIQTLPLYLDGKITPKEQDHEQATYVKIIKKEDGHINWNDPAEQIERKIRAYTPWPGTYTYWNNKLLKILEADTLQDVPQKAPGTVYESGNTIAISTGKNSLTPTLVQLEGRSPTDIQSFLRGHKDFSRTVLK